MKRKNKRNILFIIIILIIIIISYFIRYKWIDNMFLSPEEQIVAVLEYNRNREFNGVVIDKYIDKKEHNSNTIVLLENIEKRNILINFESGGLFDFLAINDSIIKTKNNLKVRIIRNNLDTIINMRFLYMSPEEYNSEKK